MIKSYYDTWYGSIVHIFIFLCKWISISSSSINVTEKYNVYIMLFGTVLKQELLHSADAQKKK
jgi:hypothetical protein